MTTLIFASIAPGIFVGRYNMSKCDFCGNEYEELFRFDDNYSQSLVCRFCLAEYEEDNQTLFDCEKVGDEE
jgi:hypothetical protein